MKKKIRSMGRHFSFSIRHEVIGTATAVSLLGNSVSFLRVSSGKIMDSERSDSVSPVPWPHPGELQTHHRTVTQRTASGPVISLRFALDLPQKEIWDGWHDFLPADTYYLPIIDLSLEN